MDPEIELAKETVVNIPAATSSVTGDVTRVDGKHVSIIERIKDVYRAERRAEFTQFRGNLFLISCVLAVSMDPLFLYIPLIDQDLKCVRLDSKLRVVALICRSVTDLHCLWILFWQFKCMMSYGRTFSISSLFTRSTLSQIPLIDILAAVPIPHVAILTLPDSNPLPFRNSLLVLQYVPRVLRIFQLRRDGGIGWNHNSRFQSSHSRTWIRGLFMFFVFILASHILGAFWYYFSFQRNIDCWLFACTRENQCQSGTFSCRRDHTTKNITSLLNDACPINLPNARLFNFGIYLDALQSGMLNSTDFPQKFLHCFWWGLRNLSSFGQNLETSTYAWENLFAVLICMIGMLVVLVYLNAILQTYMQMEAKKSDLMEIEERRTMDIETWLCVNDLSGELKTEIMGYVLEKLKADEVVNNVKVLSVIPWRLSLEIKKNLCLDMLQKVPMFRAGGERTMDLICGYLKPIIYKENSFILQEGDPVDKMLFITHGVAFIYRTSPDRSGSSKTSSISKGDHYGEQLLNLAPDMDHLSLPRSNWSVKCSTNVEAFFLMAGDLRNIKIDLVEKEEAIKIDIESALCMSTGSTDHLLND